MTAVGLKKQESLPESAIATFERGQITDLLSMLWNYAHIFYKTAEMLEGVVTATRMQSDPALRPEVKEMVLAEARTLKHNCSKMGLVMTEKALDRFLLLSDSALNNPLVSQHFEEIHRRFDDELSGIQFLYLTAEQSWLYLKSRPFGAAVGYAFPSAAYDLDEAAKCLALDRGTACVFHLMRSLEAPLRQLAKEVGVPSDENWNKVLNSFDKMLTALRETMQANSAAKPPDWKEREAFYSEASALLRNVKNAWRNEVMHLEKKYTVEEAKKVFTATGDFMKFLATRLSE